MKKVDQKMILMGLGVIGVLFLASKAKSSTSGKNALITHNAWHYPEGAIQYVGFFEKYTKMYDLPPNLLSAVAERESQYDQNAMGDNGTSYGLMQIKPKFHPSPIYNGVFNTSWTKWSSEPMHWMNPEISIEYAGWYLRRLMKYLKGLEVKNNAPIGSIANWANVLVSYNWGMGDFTKYLEGELDIPLPRVEYADDITTKVGLPIFNPVSGFIN